MIDEENKVEINVREVNITEGNETPEATATKFAEWQTPAGSLHRDREPKECFITGMADEAYAINFGLLTGFDAKDYPYVSVSIIFDGITKAGYLFSLPKFKNLDIKEKDFTYHTVAGKNMDGKRMKLAFVFEPTKGKDPSNMGSIVAKVQRTNATFIGGTNGGTYVRKDAKIEDEEDFVYKFFYASTRTLRSFGVPIPQKSADLVVPALRTRANASIPSGPGLALAKTLSHQSHVGTKGAVGVTKPNTLASKSRKEGDGGLETAVSAIVSTAAHVIPSATMTGATPKAAPTSSVPDCTTHFNKDSDDSLEKTLNVFGNISPVTWEDIGQAVAETSNHLFTSTHTPISNGAGLPYTPPATAVSAFRGFTGTSTLQSKRKESVTESTTAAIYRGGEESPLAKKAKASLLEPPAAPHKTSQASIFSSRASTQPIKVETQTTKAGNENDEVVCFGTRHQYEEQKKKEERLKLELEELEAEEQFELERLRIKAAIAAKKTKMKKKFLFGDE